MIIRSAALSFLCADTRLKIRVSVCTDTYFAIRAVARIINPAAIYNRVKRFGSDVRSSPLQSAPMAFFCPETVVILHREQTRLWKPQRRIFETLVRDSPARLFPIARWERAVPLYAEKFFGIQRCSLCEAGWRSRVTPPYNLRYDKFKKEDRTPDNDRSQSPQV